MGRRKSERTGVVVLIADPTLVAWGRRIEQRLDILDLTQEDLAEEIGVTHVSVWRWVNGKAEPRRHHKKAIAEALHTTVSDLFSEVA